MDMKINQEEIQKQAKQILDKFAKALEKIERETAKDTNFSADREESERKEENGNEPNSEFKKRILENSPRHDDDFIIAERGEWK